MLGGTQRQIGVLAAAGIEAIETLTQRLADDHAMAQRLHAALHDLRPGLVHIAQPATNIQFVELADTLPDSAAWARELARHGVLVRPWGPRRIRLVTHRHITGTCIDTAAKAFRQAAHDLLG
jgi:threonine aldolase